jgi:hypothetical protein
MAPHKFQEEINFVIDQEQDHIFNQIPIDEDHAGASGDLMDYVFGSTDSTPDEFNNFFNPEMFEDNIPIDFDLDMFVNEEQVETPNPNQKNGENTNQILGDLVNSTIGDLSITPPETPLAIDDDIATILNESNIIVLDETLQDQCNSTIFPNVPTPEIITDVATNEAAPGVEQEVKKHGRGRPKTSALKAEVDDIKDQHIRRRKFNNASSARHRRNQKRKHEEMEDALVFETEKNARLTVEVELLEKQVEDFKAKILDIIKKPRVMEVVSEPVVQENPEAFPDIFDLL